MENKFMGVLSTEEQLELQQMVRDFAKKEVTPISLECDKSGEIPMNIYKKALKMELHMVEIPEEYGGAGLDCLTAAIMNEELAIADAGFATTVGASGLAAKPVFIAGTHEQKKLFADILAEGKMAAFCLTEPDAGSDAGAVKTTAVKDGDEYVINGSKCFITCGGISDVYTVIASTGKSKGLKGLSIFIVERNRLGISIGKEEDKMGIRLSNTTDVIFTDVRVPLNHLVGNEGEGFKIAMRTLDLSRPMVAATAVGICQSAVNHSIKYAKERRTFGKPIANLQAIQMMIADMEIKTETARRYYQYAAELIKQGKPISKAAAIAKCYSGDCAMQVTTDAVQIFGGYGYSREYPVEKLMRDAKIFQIFEGTNQIQRVVIANNVLK